MSHRTTTCSPVGATHRPRRSTFARRVWWVLAIGLAVGQAIHCRAESLATNPGGMIATVHPLATEAGIAAWQRGGNAVDAAVAAALTLGVVDGHNSGLGGGCFVLIRCPDGRIVAVDGRERAPHTASRDMYLRDGKAQGELSTTGPLAVATPGALAAYDRVLADHGRLALASLLLPAAKIAEDGFAVDRILAGNLASSAKDLAKFEGSRRSLLKRDGSPYGEGELLRQPDLAKTYRAIASQGVDWFYQGEFATVVGTWMAENGGLLSARDFADYAVRDREPLITSYRGWKIIGFPPPSSGGVHVAEILQIVEHFDLAEVHKESSEKFVHVVAEAMKLAFADRAYWLGDPDHVRVPRGLIRRDYAASLANRINMKKSTPVSRHGDPPGADDDFFGSHTTHIAAADREGWWVAITATVNTSFGSKVIVPGTGVVLNNQMDDFSIDPGVPNAFGLVGAESNAVAPGKRPLSSMSPTLVMKNDQPVLSLGAAGGPTIISQVVQVLIRHLDLGMPLAEAVANPRFHHQWSPDTLFVEKSCPAEWLGPLENRGHTIRQRTTIGVTQAIQFDPSQRLFLGVHDPRIPGKAAGPSATR